MFYPAANPNGQRPSLIDKPIALNILMSLSFMALREHASKDLRDLEAVAAIAQSVGFSVPTITEMPANNLSVVFHRI
jgi:hypothetical protein